MEDNFNPINRLLEFGMGMAMAQQMIKVMNEANRNFQTPANINLQQTKPLDRYYVAIDDKPYGPIVMMEINNLILQKKINGQTLVWKQGMQNWDLAINLSELKQMLPSIPPPLK